jgi:hypothetical protein
LSKVRQKSCSQTRTHKAHLLYGLSQRQESQPSRLTLNRDIDNNHCLRTSFEQFGVASQVLIHPELTSFEVCNAKSSTGTRFHLPGSPLATSLVSHRCVVLNKEITLATPKSGIYHHHMEIKKLIVHPSLPVRLLRKVRCITCCTSDTDCSDRTYLRAAAAAAAAAAGPHVGLADSQTTA